MLLLGGRPVVAETAPHECARIRERTGAHPIRMAYKCARERKRCAVFARMAAPLSRRCSTRCPLRRRPDQGPCSPARGTARTAP